MCRVVSWPAFQTAECHTQIERCCRSIRYHFTLDNVIVQFIILSPQHCTVTTVLPSYTSASLRLTFQQRRELPSPYLISLSSLITGNLHPFVCIHLLSGVAQCSRIDGEQRRWLVGRAKEALVVAHIRSEQYIHGTTDRHQQIRWSQHTAATQSGLSHACHPLC